MSRPSQSAPSPKYAALAAQIRSQIRAGVLRPGDRLPTFAEMCAQHEVTPTTITRVYSLLQQEGLITCVRGRGSFVAEPPPKTTTGIFGVIGMGGMRHPYSSGLMRGFAEAASQSGVELLLMDSRVPPQWERMDGVILHGSNAPGVLRKLPADVPAVVVMASVPDVACVMADDRAGISALMAHLLSLGHRRIAALIDPLSPQRLSAHRDALHDAEIEVDSRWIRHVAQHSTPEYSYADLAYEAMQQWLREDWDDLACTAIVTQNDDTANGVITALREAGKRVPEEVSVTGFDGTEVGHYLRPFLTTVQVPLEEIGILSVELLQRQIAGEVVRAATIMLPVLLRTSDSTAFRADAKQPVA